MVFNLTGSSILSDFYLWDLTFISPICQGLTLHLCDLHLFDLTFIAPLLLELRRTYTTCIYLI